MSEGSSTRRARLRHRLFHLYFLARRPMTLGVRVGIFDDWGRVLLVRHTYVEGWYMPGGGVETGETVEMAARKEVREEARIEAGELALVGVYKNERSSRRDHVVLYACRDWQSVGEFIANGEIAGIGFFPLDALPHDTSPSTRERLVDADQGRQLSAYW
jgi:8-oxo-dGTP pyrophosphatase MutT (NUDIX family)